MTPREHDLCTSLGRHPNPASMSNWTYWPVLTRPLRATASFEVFGSAAIVAQCR